MGILGALFAFAPGDRVIRSGCKGVLTENDLVTLKHDGSPKGVEKSVPPTTPDGQGELVFDGKSARGPDAAGPKATDGGAFKIICVGRADLSLPRRLTLLG